MKKLLVLLAVIIVLAACGYTIPEITATTTVPPTHTPQASPSPYPTHTPYPTYTPLPTGTATPTNTPIPTGTATPIPTMVPLPTPFIRPLVYVIQPGDTLFDIANRYDVPADDIASINRLVNPNVIYAGQILIIPIPFGPSGSPRFERTYLIVSLSLQRLYVIQENQWTNVFIVSTGIPETPTPTGQFSVLTKNEYRDWVVGGGEVRVAYELVLNNGYTLSSVADRTYFGFPSSETGDVEMATEDAKWLFDYIPLGATVVIQP